MLCLVDEGYWLTWFFEQTFRTCYRNFKSISNIAYQFVFFFLPKKKERRQTNSAFYLTVCARTFATALQLREEAGYRLLDLEQAVDYVNTLDWNVSLCQ